MSEGVGIYFSPKSPLVWYAQYHSDIKELKIPKCLKCNKLIKVKDYNKIICDKCGSFDITFEKDNGAKIIPINNVLLEYDEKGESTIKYDYIPLDGLVNFGLLDPVTYMSYGIEIQSGFITMRDFRNSGDMFYLASGINTDTKSSNLIKVSDAIINKEAEINLHYSKRAVLNGKMKVSVLNYKLNTDFEMDPANFTIDNISVGYTCKIPGWDFEIILRIDCNSHVPYITSNATPIK